MADLSSLLQTYIQQPRGLQNVTPGLTGLGQILGQQALAQQAAKQELANQIELARAKAQMENEFNPLSRFGSNLDTAVKLNSLGALTPELGQALLGGVQGQAQQQSRTSIPRENVVNSEPLVGGFNRLSSTQSPSNDLVATKFEPSMNLLTGNMTAQPKEIQSLSGMKKLEGEKAKIDIQKANAKELTEKFGQAGRIVQMMSNLEGFGKAIDEDFPGGSGAKAQLFGLATKFPFRSKEFQQETLPVQRYLAQMEETKIAALPILSGQSRYVVDLAKAIQATIPTPGEITKNRQELISQSIRNMLTLVYGVQNGQFSAENLISKGIDPNGTITNKDMAQSLLQSTQLTPEQENSIETAIDSVISTPPIRGGKKEKQGTSGTTSSGLKYTIEE